MEDKLIYAKHKKCYDCGEPAVAFFPVFDPDIPRHPYCRKHTEERKLSLMKKLIKL